MLTEYLGRSGVDFSVLDMGVEGIHKRSDLEGGVRMGVYVSRSAEYTRA